MAGLIVVGSSNTDLVIRVERLPREGETVVKGQIRLWQQKREGLMFCS